MRIQYLFYVIGIIFLFTTVAYFAYEYLFSLSDIVKSIILVCLVIIFFFIGDHLRERNI